MAVRLQTLGQTRIETDTGALPPGVRSGKPFALLLYLALNRGQSLTRDALVDLLWSPQAPESGRQSLRQALYLLRRVLPTDSLLTEGDAVVLAGGVKLDVDAFQEAVSEGDAPRALGAYGGDFLEGFHVEGAAAFDHWADGKRAALRTLFRTFALEEVKRRDRAGEWPGALTLLDRVAGRDQLDPELRVLRIELLHKVGRGPEAAAEATLLQEAYRETFDTDLPPELADRLHRVLAIVWDREWSDEGAPSDPGRDAGALAGRTAELSRLLRAWERAGGGEGMVALVVGDPGIGKTRLMEEVLRPAELDGATILRGKSYELENGLLYGALVDVMRQAIHAPGFPGVSDVWLAELARLLPELQERYPRIAGNGNGNGNGDGNGGADGSGRRRFYEAVAQVFEALTFEAPVACLLDDLHWADEATLELLHYLSRRLCAVPVLFLVALRPGQSSESLLRLKRVLVEEHGGLEVTLAPLEKSDVDALLASLAGDHPPPSGLLETVWGRSEGNPFFALATLEALERKGAATLSDQGWSFDAQAASELADIPEPMREILDGWLGGLSEAHREFLEIGAVAGRAFPPVIFGEVLELGAPEVFRILSELERRHILVCREREGVTTWDFVHDRLREAVYLGIPEGRQRELHGLVAGVERVASGLEAASLARHFGRAGLRELAFRNALAGADWARMVFAVAGEREMLQLAAEFAPSEKDQQDVLARLEAVPSAEDAGPPGPGPLSRPAPSRRRLWPWAFAGAAAVVATVATWNGVRSGLNEGGLSPLPPLPEGALVWMTADDGEGYAVVDLERASAESYRLAPDEFTNVGDESMSANVLLSPDLERVATSLTRPGIPSDAYVSRRDGAEIERLTTHPDDDRPLAWLPDGSGVLIKTLMGGEGESYGYNLGLARLGSDSVRLLIQSADQVLGATISPDGTRIAYTRMGESGEVWIANFDGTEARRLAAGLVAPSTVAWSPSDSLLVVRDSRAEGQQLVAVHVSPPGTGPSGPGLEPFELNHPDLSPEFFAWAPDGSRVYFSAAREGNHELFFVRPDGSEATRLTYSRAEEHLVGLTQPATVPWVDHVEILTGVAGEIGVGKGDELLVRAAVIDSDGQVMLGRRPRFRCLDEEVCRASSDGAVQATGPGSTLLTADVGGWRADTVRVRVVDRAPSMVLEEEWEEGIDEGTWQLFGVPEPVLVAGAGRDGSAGFQAAGNDKWESGVVTRRAFSMVRGLSVDAWGRGSFRTPWPSWQVFGMAVTADSLSAFQGDGPQPDLRPSLTISGNEPNRPPQMAFLGNLQRPSERWDPEEWHRYTLQFLPGGDAEVWVDEERLWKVEGGAPAADSVRVVLFGRATDGPVIHDEVRIYEGVLRGG